MKKTVWITTHFVGFHRWAGAPEETAFLRDFHRHVFHVRLSAAVGNGNREIEFLDLKKRVNDYLKAEWEGVYFESSCEDIAATLARKFNASSVEVSEDGENGAVVEQSVSELVRDRCFIGIEAEGPNRGKITLFVPGNTTAERLEQVLQSEVVSKHCQQVYYGAGCCHELKEDVLLALKECRHPVFVEGHSFGKHMRDFQFTLVSLDGNGVFDYKKTVENGLIVWEGCNQRHVTLKSDPLFSGDFFLE